MKTKNLPKWQRKLSAAERRHLKEMGISTLWGARNSAKFQELNMFPCWECVSIGRKLGVELDLKKFNEMEDV